LQTSFESQVIVQAFCVPSHLYKISIT